MRSREIEDKVKELDEASHRRYRALVGKLMWLATVRPDLSFPVKELARAVQSPTEKDNLNLKRVLKYFIHTKDYKMCLQYDPDQNPVKLEAIVDASWANAADRKSSSGGVLQVQGFTLAWWSLTQPVIAQSTCEAELIALNVGGCEARYAQEILKELGMDIQITLFSDSMSACKLTAKRGPGRMRHMDIKRLWLQEEVRAGRIVIDRIATNVNIADLMTKYIDKNRLETLLDLIALRPNEEPTGATASRG